LNSGQELQPEFGAGSCNERRDARHASSLGHCAPAGMQASCSAAAARRAAPLRMAMQMSSTRASRRPAVIDAAKIY
jgi:hypothetical protein